MDMQVTRLVAHGQIMRERIENTLLLGHNALIM